MILMLPRLNFVQIRYEKFFCPFFLLLLSHTESNEFLSLFLSQFPHRSSNPLDQECAHLDRL